MVGMSVVECPRRSWSRKRVPGSWNMALVAELRLSGVHYIMVWWCGFELTPVAGHSRRYSNGSILPDLFSS